MGRWGDLLLGYIPSPVSNQGAIACESLSVIVPTTYSYNELSFFFIFSYFESERLATHEPN